METLTKESTTMNVEKVNKQESSNKELVKRKEIEGTPFTIVSVKEEHFGAMGGYRITEKKDNIGEIEDELKCITWNRIVQVIMILQQMKENTDKAIKDELTKNNK